MGKKLLNERKNQYTLYHNDLMKTPTLWDFSKYSVTRPATFKYTQYECMTLQTP